MAKIVVFGADGFIGRHLVLKLAEKKSNQIIAFDRFSSFVTGGDHPFESLGNVKILPGNFSNRNDVEDVLSEDAYVFHLISTTNPATSDEDPFIDVDTNIRNSVELFELCSESGVKKVIFLSSGGTVYGDIDSDSIDEETVPRPRSPYGIGKLAIENYLRYFKHKFGLDYVVYRVANPYGPGQNIYGKQGVIPIFMRKVLENEAVTIYGEGDMVRDYLYIDDLIHMISETYPENNKFSEYNIGSGTGESVKELVEAIESCVGHKIIKTHLETPATFTAKAVLDIKRFVDEFNITPRTSLSVGLARTWDYVKQSI